MKTLIYILIALFLSSCGSNNFAKRKYMKGVYVEKRTQVKSKRENSSNFAKASSDNGKGEKNRGSNNRNTDKEEKNEVIRLKDAEKNEKEIESTTEDQILEEKLDSFDKEENTESKNDYDHNPPKVQDGEVLKKNEDSTESILAFVFGFLGFLFWILSIVAIVLGSIGYKKDRGKKGLTGIIMGSITLFLYVIVVPVIAVLVILFI